VGEAGIGKTRLLAELRSRAEARGALTLDGRAAEYEREVPFGVFLDALDDHAGSLAPRRLKRLDAETRRELGRLFPALSFLAGEGAESLQAERHRAHGAVRTLLEIVADARPLLLALDDVHWADAASLELISHLLRHPPSGPLVMALAYRPRQLPGRLRDELQARPDHASSTFTLAPLSEPEAAELLGSEAPELYRQSGGNPFYLEQLARARP
jgi:predicted ATPase